MRKIIYSMMVSTDGFIEDAKGSLGWSIPDEELHKHFNDLYLTGEIQTSLYGRRLYEIMAAYWPTADTNPSASEVEIEFARAWKKIPRVVFSKTLDRVEWNSTLVREVVPEDVIQWKQQPGGDMDIGGAELASTFIRLGLVDEIRLYVHPVILGGGKPMFPRDVRVNLRLADKHQFGSGVILLTYRVLSTRDPS